jgi:putative transposase
VFVCETEPQPLEPCGSEAGIDVGIRALIATDTGEFVRHPGWYRASERRLRTAQRRVARRTKGGANRRRAIAMLQRVHRDTANQRQDFLRKLAYRLVQANDVLVLEDLRVRNMVRNGHLAKSILDKGWKALLTYLVHEAEDAGRRVALVPAPYSSQTCSSCGARHNLGLKDGSLDCACGLRLDRDTNAARNHLTAYRLGHSRWATSSELSGLAQEAARF